MKFFFLEVEKGTVKLSGFYPEWAKPTYKILSLLVVAFFAVVAFPFIPGSSSSAFKGISIFGAVSFPWFPVRNIQHHRRVGFNLQEGLQGWRPGQDC